MDNFSKNPNFLNQRFPGFANTSEVKAAVRRTEVKTGESLAKNLEVKIQNYLDRFSEILHRSEPEKSSGIRALKKLLIEKFVVRVEDVPEAYWSAQMKVVRDLGMSGDWQSLSAAEILEQKEDHLKTTKEDQKGSLEEWIDFLSSEKTASVPDYLKYWLFQGMLRLERYEKGSKEKDIQGRFPERPSGRQRSIKLFPEVNERGIKFIAQAYKSLATNASIHFRHDTPEPAKTEFVDLLEKKDFRAIYSWTQEHIPPISEEEMQEVRGEWKKFSAGETQALIDSLQGKGLGWCIAGRETAEKYLSKGSLHVFYTYGAGDEPNQPTIPRVAIVHNGKRVTEVRGIDWEENIDDYIKPTNIIADKLLEPEMNGEAFYATDADTKKLTQIDKKSAKGESLTGDELAFLYEMEKPVLYFGQKRDPRIDELRTLRKPREDILVISDYFEKSAQSPPAGLAEVLHALAIEQKTPSTLTAADLRFLYQVQRKIQIPGFFKSIVASIRTRVLEQRNPQEDVFVALGSDTKPLQKSEIARDREQITAHTKAYIGPLFPGFFKVLGGIEHIYTDFPEGKISKKQVIVDEKDGAKIISAMEEDGIQVENIAQAMIRSQQSAQAINPLEWVRTSLNGASAEKIYLINLRIKDLGFTVYATTEELFARAKVLGLELCPAMVGPYYLLQQTERFSPEWADIATIPIEVPGIQGGRLFSIFQTGDGFVNLGYSWSTHDMLWDPNRSFVFRYRKR